MLQTEKKRELQIAEQKFLILNFPYYINKRATL